MTEEALEKLQREAAETRRQAIQELQSRELSTPEACDKYVREVYETFHLILLAEIYPYTPWFGSDYRRAALEYAIEHLYSAWGNK